MTDLQGMTGFAASELVKSSDIAIRVENVSKRFRLHTDRASSIKEALTYRRKQRLGAAEFWALRDVSFEIETGSSYGLIGHNGCGKSTLLRCIAGIHRPTSGSVATEGRISALLELGAGFHPELSGRENIYLNASILGLTRREVNSVIDEIIDFAQIPGHIDSPVKHYSSGMYVRLGFAVAVHVRPEILLIDEVIAVGDEEFQRKCFEHLYRLRREGVTIVMVSHGAPIIESMCDKVAWLDHGVMLAEGKPADVMGQYMQKVNQAEADRLEAEHASERVVESGSVAPTEVVASDATRDQGPELVVASAEGDEVRGSATRRGSGEIRVESVEYLDSEGVVRPTGITGDHLRIRVKYKSTVPIVEPVVGLEIRHESGAHLAGPNSRFGEVPLGTVMGSGSVDFVLDPLPLMPGNYRMSVAIVDDHMQHTYDLLDQTLTLRVQPGSQRERFGMVDLHGRWERG